MQSTKVNLFSLAILIITSFGVYLSTIGPTVYLGDSGELTAAAFSLGIPHNSGYPLYTLMGKLFCLIPLGNVGFRMNLMSSCFAVATLLLVYSMIYQLCSSKGAALIGSLILAFNPIFWLQTVSSEVYTLHTFFVALLIRILWWWDEKRALHLLILLVFITGLSFGNHMQTVMLAPAVLFIVIMVGKKTLFNLKNFLVLFLVFITALLVYLYLPIRTEAGAAIHWGDPNNLVRFLAHVTGSSHRAGYVLTGNTLEYLQRTNETLWLLASQFGATLLLALWGWLKLDSVRWRVFFILVIVFDFIYTIFLNVITLEATAFVLPTSVILAVLSGAGIGHILKASERLVGVNLTTKNIIRGACYLLPAIPLVINYSLCNQKRNYTAYEHAINIFRTTVPGGILFLEGDNHFFPVVYGRLVEKMRQDVILFDRHHIIFKMPYLGDQQGKFRGTWENYKDLLEKNIIEKMSPFGIYYAVFLPSNIPMPAEYTLVPDGTLHRVVKKEASSKTHIIKNVWKYYASESFYDSFEKDFMNRQVHAHFFLRQGHFLFMANQPNLGLKYFKRASEVGYRDAVVHSAIAGILTDHGYYDEARQELEKASSHYENPNLEHNDWGVFYYKTGDYPEAIKHFRIASQMKPRNFVCLKNLAFALDKSGQREEAIQAFKESLDVNIDQPEIFEYMEKNGFNVNIEEFHRVR